MYLNEKIFEIKLIMRRILRIGEEKMQGSQDLFKSMGIALFLEQIWAFVDDLIRFNLRPSELWRHGRL